MSRFVNYAAEADAIELELIRKGIALGIDWDDHQQVRVIAAHAIDCRPHEIDCHLEDPINAARFRLFGIAQLMLQVMRQSAEHDLHTHGGPAWKAFARALWLEYSARASDG